MPPPPADFLSRPDEVLGDRRDDLRWRRLDEDDIRRFLVQVESARLTYAASPGEGEQIGITGGVNGTALAIRGTAVHLNLYPGVALYRE